MRGGGSSLFGGERREDHRDNSREGVEIGMQFDIFGDVQ